MAIGRSRNGRWFTLASGAARGARAFTIIEMATVVTVIGLLATLAMPGIIKSRKASQVKFCINNLRQLEGAKTQWALDFRKNEDDIPIMDEVVPYLRGEKAPNCIQRV